MVMHIQEWFSKLLCQFNNDYMMINVYMEKKMYFLPSSFLEGRKSFGKAMAIKAEFFTTIYVAYLIRYPFESDREGVVHRVD